MSTLVRTLLALFAAVAVSVAAWAGLCAVGIEKARVAPGPPDVPPPPAPDVTLVPLQRVTSTTDASANRPARGHGELHVALLGEPGTEPLVLTVFDGWSGAPLGARLLDASTQTAGRVVVADLPTGSHRVTLARNAALARTSYLTAATAKVAIPPEQAEPAELDRSTGSLSVIVLDDRGGPAANIVVAVERADDAAWRCPPAPEADTAHVITDANGRAKLGPLGAGRYRVRALLVDAGAEEVSFPAVTSTTLRLRPMR